MLQIRLSQIRVAAGVKRFGANISYPNVSQFHVIYSRCVQRVMEAIRGY